PGTYEAGEEDKATFWFENRNDKPVTMKLKKVSCSTCSGGQVAAVPADKLRQLVRAADEGNALTVMTDPAALAIYRVVTAAGAGADLLRGLHWQTHAFKDNPHATFEVPAAGPDGPQWCLLNLTFRAGGSPQPLTAEFVTQVQGTAQVGENSFAIRYR